MEGGLMMSEHGEPCSGKDASFCMNGATCYKLPSMDTLSCVCNVNYIGHRCERQELFIISPTPEETGLIAAVVILVILILVALVFIIFKVYKLVKAKNSSDSRHQPKYKNPNTDV
ncbi:pro-neuregulin-4, membrane-bound isoform [Oryzias melastigma]|uniref:pro-neuregulin-4, membrane-bound isoform n=1 Tax=Oryzias melastigma TaxID=30732 RepID=UPI000CF7B71D|nr:pro-neuregulin-4, membrane-bound isoform [Oryzias melastigma]